ncbi:hypothetical protein PR202_gb14961 [Eleusine coracana subsp. coracana]|uniref:Uncharacterized protein n=1 Tax=Eleusine coracana subsp. coracana TaxID=191504 RepID=A0AAV5EWM1_ELECO|nr:hypothetical protein PR202_gb14961 [Eleusine coracana subsp. coracana]
MTWLDAKEKAGESVLYVSFGTCAGRMPPAQVMAFGFALVSCPWPMLWVIKGADSLPDDVNKWLQSNTDADDVPESQSSYCARGRRRSRSWSTRPWASF